ncbi:MAG TPA: phospholipid carrier-dependent glycosyltransferase [Candidatus Limnocylindrales bacterium]|nr:phospholipid carrier-dependent glycosyltransferase [Candidatus Limnocylindrales bacterium]
MPDRGTSGAARTFETGRAAAALALVLGAGLALRLIIAYQLPGSGFEVDLNAFRFWAGNLADQGPFGFYDRPFFHDYTPGYLYLLWAVGIVGNALGGIGDLIKVPAILADLALGYLAHSLVLELTGNRRRALLAAAIVVFNPITWFDSVVWGQVDSVGVVFLLLGLRELWRDRPERAALWATVAAVVKPQLGILVPLVAIVVIRRALAGQPVDEAGVEASPEPGPRYPWWRIVTTATVGLLTAILLSAPFGLSFPGLLQQVADTAGGYPWLTVNAYNPWALVSHDGVGLAASGQWLCDAITATPGGSSAGTPCPPGMETLVGPVWAVAVGGALLVAAVLAVVAVTWLRTDRRTILVGLVVLSFAFFILPTRVHERYLFPFVALGAVLAAVSIRWRAAYVVSSLATFLNLYVVLTTLYPDNPQIADWLQIGGAIRSPAGVAVVALLNTAVFAWAILQLRPAGRATFARDVDDAILEARDAAAAQGRTATDSSSTGAVTAGGDLPIPTLAATQPPELEEDELPGLWAWVRARLTEPGIRADRSRVLAGEPGGRFDRLDIWLVLVLVVASLVLRTWRLAEPYQMHFDEVYHARTATEFLQKWRYGMDHDIYEWTHPHIAKYAMAAGIVLFGDDEVSATGDLEVPVVDAVIEPRRDDPGFDRAGDRLYVATGTDVRAYDLATRRLTATITGSNATAVAFDDDTGSLFVGAADGSIRELATAVTLDGVAAGSGPATVATTPLATISGPVNRLVASGDGSWLVAASGDAASVVDPDTGTVTGTATVAGLADVAPAGTSDTLVARPADVPDPSAAASELAQLLGGSPGTYEKELSADTDQVVVGAAIDASNRPSIDAAISDGTLAGFSVEGRPRIVAAGTGGLTFLSPTGRTISQITTDGAATGLAYVSNLDTPRLYVADGHQLTIVSLGTNGSETPTIDSRLPMPGAVTRTYWDPATLMIHALGRTADGSASTVYVVEPHGNAVYADARLPFTPVATALDIAPDFPTSDREQLLAFDGGGRTAAVDLGENAFGWRLPGVIAGALTAGLLYLLARLLFRRRSIAVLTAVFVLADGMFFVMARIGMNDAYVGLFLVAAYLVFAGLWLERWRWRGAFWIGMPVLGVLLGLGLASKWVAAYAIGALGILYLARSALGRVILIAGMLAATTALGYLAIGVPAAKASGPNLAFMIIMVGLTALAVAVAVLRPIAWSRDETRFAIGTPVVAGAALIAVAAVRGFPVVHVGSLALPVAVLGVLGVVVGLGVWLVFRVAAAFGFGPFAMPPPPGDPAAALEPAAPAADGWLRPGWRFGLPLVWTAVCLLAVPLAVYVVSYLPWAAIDGHQIVPGFPAGHGGQTLADLTKQMYDYHNDLRAGHAASSPWWAWPLDLKPVWFYQGSFAGGTAASIYDAGNVVLWWLSIPALAFVAWQSYRRRSLALALIGIGFACQWIAWARIDRATFQYHYYTSLPFVVLALAYFVAELWHGPSPRTWLLARLASAAVIVGPMALWVFKAPLCGFVGVERASPGSLACVGSPGNLVVTARSAGLAGVLVVALVLIGRELVIRDGGSVERHATGGWLGRIVLIAAAAGIGIAATTILDPTTPIVSLQGFRPELVAFLMLIPLGALAWVVVTARDARRFAVGLVAAIVGWFVILYPNISALPLPTSLVNAYQGLLPTYLYPFQFPVNTDAVPPPVRLFALGPLLLFVGLVVFCGVLAYAAWVWRLAAAERTPQGDDEVPRAPDEPPLGGTRVDGTGLASSSQPGI